MVETQGIQISSLGLQAENRIYLKKGLKREKNQVCYILDEEQGRVVRCEINPGDIVRGMYTTKSISPLDIQAVNGMY